MKKFILLFFALIPSILSLGIAPITGTTHVCAGSATTLMDATAGGVWTSSNLAIATINVAGTMGGVSAGIANITYTVGAAYVTIPITVNALPVVFTVTGGGPYCAGDSGVHIGLSGSQTGTNYFLYHGASSTGPYAGSGSPLNFGLQTAAGVYTVVGTASSTLCTNSMTGSATVSINPSVTPSVAISTVLGDTLCSGIVTRFNAITLNGGTTPGFQWNVNGVNVGGDSAHYSYIPANGDLIKITLISSAVCASPDTITILDTLTVLPTAAPTVSIAAGPGSRVCQGIAVTFTAIPVYGGPAPAYRWYKNGTLSATGPSFSFIPVNGDIVHCTMRSNYHCRLADTALSASTTLVVDTPVTPYVAIISTPGTTIGNGQFDTLTANVANAGPSPTYQWYINTESIPGATTTTYISDTFSAPYPDSVTCIVTGSGACRISAYTWVYIIVSNVGVASIGSNGENILIYPNPANTELNLENAKGVIFTLYDMIGREMYCLAVSSQVETVNIATLPRGMYVAQFFDQSSGEKVTKRVLKD